MCRALFFPRLSVAIRTLALDKLRSCFRKFHGRNDTIHDVTVSYYLCWKVTESYRKSMKVTDLTLYSCSRILFPTLHVVRSSHKI